MVAFLLCGSWLHTVCRVGMRVRFDPREVLAGEADAGSLVGSPCQFCQWRKIHCVINVVKSHGTKARVSRT